MSQFHISLKIPVRSISLCKYIFCILLNLDLVLQHLKLIWVIPFSYSSSIEEHTDFVKYDLISDSRQMELRIKACESSTFCCFLLPGPTLRLQCWVGFLLVLPQRRCRHLCSPWRLHRDWGALIPFSIRPPLCKFYTRIYSTCRVCGNIWLSTESLKHYKSMCLFTL